MTAPGFPPASWEAQHQRLDGERLDDAYVRAAGVEIARRCSGRAIVDNPAIYDAMYPYDPAWARRDLAAGQDHCALFAIMVLRAMGFALPDDGIAEATRFGTVPLPPGRRAILDPMSRLRELPGFIRGNACPPEGTAVMIGRVSEPSSTHVAWVYAYDDGHALTYDGGRRDIHATRREIRTLGTQRCLYDAAMGNRPILGHVDPALMRALVVRDYVVPPP